MLSTVWNSLRDPQLSREEKGEGGGRGDLGEKRESQKRIAIKPVITTLSENGYRKVFRFLKVKN